MLLGLAGCESTQGYDRGSAAYRRSDHTTALREWRPLAEQGYAEAQSNLGVLYERGEGVPRDYAEAVRWYRLAAKQGHLAAQHNLGVMYFEGRGVPQDYGEATMLFGFGGASRRFDTRVRTH